MSTFSEDFVHRYAHLVADRVDLMDLGDGTLALHFGRHRSEPFKLHGTHQEMLGDLSARVEAIMGLT